MRYLIFVLLVLCGFSFVAVADNNSDYRARLKKRVEWCEEGIARSHELKKLELQYKIYCKELEMQKDNQYNISVSSPRMEQNSDIDIRNILEQRMRRITVEK